MNCEEFANLVEARWFGRRQQLTFTPFPDPRGMLDSCKSGVFSRRIGTIGRKHFTEEQIAFALRQYEGWTAVVEIIRKLGISKKTFYRWKKKFSGLGVAELRRLKQLEEENRKLKQLVADLSLDKKMLQDVLSKKRVKPVRRRGWVGSKRPRRLINREKSRRIRDS